MDASDIHVEPLESIVRIRFRLDGVLRPIHNLPKTLHQSLLARLKILSDLDIAERRLPQDGRMKIDEVSACRYSSGDFTLFIWRKSRLAAFESVGFGIASHQSWAGPT